MLEYYNNMEHLIQKEKQYEMDISGETELSAYQI